MGLLLLYVYKCLRDKDVENEESQRSRGYDVATM
jgi:hypothetical protein